MFSTLTHSGVLRENYGALLTVLENEEKRDPAPFAPCGGSRENRNTHAGACTKTPGWFAAATVVIKISKVKLKVSYSCEL